MLKIILFAIFSILHTGANKWPAHTDVEDNAVFDYIIVGAGTAGCILANRLSEQQDVTVLAIEAGGDPPDKTDPKSLTKLGKKLSVWRYETEHEGYTDKNKNFSVVSGKMIGGSSSINHLFYTRGDIINYDSWVQAVGDESWSWKHMLPYFMKSERLEDTDIINSPMGRFHGKIGGVGVTRDLHKTLQKYINAYHSGGYRIANDLNNGHAVGFTQPMFIISEGIVQSTAEAFLKTIKNRPNFYLMKNTEVYKILFDYYKNVKGVRVKKINGRIANIFARKEVIVSAGAVNTPKLLMLSGIGPQAYLKSLGIAVHSNLPIGDNYEDHIMLLLAHGLKKTTENNKDVESVFLAPTFVGFEAVNKSQNYADYYTYNIITENDPSTLQLLCTNVFHLNEKLCKELALIGSGREVLLTAFCPGHLVSRGKIQLVTANPEDPPKVYTGLLSERSDVEKFINYVQDFVNVTISSRVGGETLDLNLTNCGIMDVHSKEYWECYIRNVMDNKAIPCCTCPMGSVLDSRLRVRGVNNLRVVDASAMPNIVAGGTHAAVMAIAEKASDLIKEDNNYNNEVCQRSCSSYFSTKDNKSCETRLFFNFN